MSSAGRAIYYADSSALAKLILIEKGSEQIHALHEQRTVFGCAAIGYPELRSAVARAARAGRVPSLRDARVGLERLWDGVLSVQLDDQMLRRAGQLAEDWELRGYDAVHLSALLTYVEPAEGVLACWDGDLRAAAAGLGYRLFPETL